MNWWCQSWFPELVDGTSWLVEQIDVGPRRVELSWRGSPDACLSASEWTGIYYLSPLPTIKPIMSCFNSLGKQAYRSHVSINVNYPGSCPHLRVHQPPQSWPPVAPAWNPICLMSMLHQVRNAMCVVQKIKAARPSLGRTQGTKRRLIWILHRHGYRSANGSVPNYWLFTLNYVSAHLHPALLVVLQKQHSKSSGFLQKYSVCQYMGNKCIYTATYSHSI